MNERVLGRLLCIVGSIAIVTVAAPDRSAGQETTRPEPQQRCIVVEGRVNENRPGAAAVVAQMAPRTFCLQEVFVLKAQ